MPPTLINRKALLVHSNSVVFSLQNSTLISLYYMLLQNTVMNEDGLVSRIKYPDRYEADLRVLEKVGAIVIHDDTILLGHNENALFANTVNPLTTERKLVHDMIVTISQSSKYKRYKSFFEDCFLLETMLDKPEKFITKLPDVIVVYRRMYGLLYSSECRDFNGKEIGQFKSLHKMYGAIVSTKLIIQYLIDASHPNVGQLLLKKDILYHKFVAQKHTDPNAMASTGSVQITKFT